MLNHDIGKFDIQRMSSGHNSINSVSNFYIRKLSASEGNERKIMPPARTAIHCFFFLKSGNVEINVAERHIVITGNDCLIIPKGEVFSVTECSSDSEGYMGGFHNDFLIGDSSDKKQLVFLYGWLSKPISLSGKTLKYVENIFDRIFDEWTSPKKDMSIIRTYTQALIQELGNQKNSMPDIGNGGAARSITETFMQQLSDLKYITVKQFASGMGITAGHLSKCVSQTTGKSPFKWIEEKIMTEAKMLLYQTDMPIGDISQKIGITDVSYFSRIFKKCEGITPNDYRKMIKKS